MILLLIIAAVWIGLSVLTKGVWALWGLGWWRQWERIHMEQQRKRRPHGD